MATFFHTFLLWLCHNLLSGMKLKNQIVNVFIFLCCLLYLVVVEVVYADLHDAREDYQYGGGDEEGVDVIK